ncbi:siderophore-interacting protein [Aeromicrobium flavum]|uniref:Siderophore-interacting protein n=1 Tax=Aeromicrobium flavum TaxID=416568 RepID=A0A512HWD2_9ACTN|nr:siderophore-interacting protein [Aeromicrobium flavum]GEO89730.1 siderophore-interacting protein [Aeromicrobium flavum]
MAQKTEVQLTVLRTEDLAPRLRRVVLGGPAFDEYLAHHLDSTDTYVKLVFDTADGEVKRTYTVRWVDAEARELAIDFVTHGTEGLAGPWAASAKPGDTLRFVGPGGAYRPDPTADHQLFVGDESALPAIAASVAVLESGAKATAFLEVDGPGHEIDLPTAGDLTVHWLHRDGVAPGSTALLDQAVRSWTWPAGRVQAFVHGESALLKTVRPYLMDGRVARGDISVSAYWRCGVTEEGFRDWKRQQQDAVIRPSR